MLREKRLVMSRWAATRCMNKTWMARRVVEGGGGAHSMWGQVDRLGQGGDVGGLGDIGGGTGGGVKPGVYQRLLTMIV